ncbi:MAG: hypothetical protein AAB547_03255 [Patescibacteria group bacterium]
MAVERTAFLAMLRDKDGHWNVPNVNWDGSKFDRNANWLDNDWDAAERVVLLDTHGFFPSGLLVPDGFCSILHFQP